VVPNNRRRWGGRLLMTPPLPAPPPPPAVSWPVPAPGRRRTRLLPLRRDAGEPHGEGRPPSRRPPFSVWLTGISTEWEETCSAPPRSWHGPRYCWRRWGRWEWWCHEWPVPPPPPVVRHHVLCASGGPHS